MKDPKLRVTIPDTRKDFYLSRTSPNDDWHIRFTPPPWMRDRLNITLRRIDRTTGTRLVPAAREQARVILRSYYGDDGGRKAEAIRGRSEIATIGELLERYLERATQRPGTKRSNASSLRLVLRAVYPSGDVDRLSCAVLTAQVVRDFESARLAGVSQDRLRNVQRTISSYLKQARSIVAPRKMKFYSDLRLPDFTGFRGETVDAPAPSMPRPLDMNAMVAMEAAVTALMSNDPAVYVAHLLFTRLGLRNIEVVNARVHWWSDGRLGIIDRPEEDFWPKGCEGYLEVAPDLWAEILRFQHLCTDGFLVPGANATERRDVVYRRHSKWVSTWIKDRTKTSYELRRYAGSRILDMNGGDIFEVRDFLRHRDVQTTQRWYAYRLQNRKMTTIGLGDLLPAVA